MEVLENTKEKFVFKEKFGYSLANAIRRSSFEIPVLAIDEVEFYKNDSVLFDEVLALRLGLIPLETPDDMNLPEECSCKGKGCSKCMVQLKLSVKGPATVYAENLEGKAKVIYPKIPIVKLREGQELEFVATARLGKAINHAKYSPGLVYYKKVPKIKEIKNKEEIKNAIEVGEEEFKKLKEGKEGSDDYIGEIVGNNGSYLKIEEGEEIIFSIESWGQIEAKKIFEKAIEALKKNLKQIK